MTFTFIENFHLEPRKIINFVNRKIIFVVRFCCPLIFLRSSIEQEIIVQ